MRHFERQNRIPSKTINLEKNYRGNLANYADEIGDTIDLVKDGKYEKELTKVTAKELQIDEDDFLSIYDRDLIKRAYG